MNIPAKHLVTLLALTCFYAPIRMAEAKGAAAGAVLSLNVDFYDLVMEYRAQKADDSLIYPRAEYEKILDRAAASGIRRIYFRVSALGANVIPSRGKLVHPKLVETVAAYDPLAITLQRVRPLGLEVFVWMTPMDDAGNDATVQTRGLAQSDFSRRNPQFQMASPSGDQDPIWGFYCFAYPEVKQYWLEQVREIGDKYQPDGFFFSDRTHSNQDLKKRKYGFNAPVVDEYKKITGTDPRQNLDLKLFSELHGKHYTALLQEVSRYLKTKGMKFHVKATWDNKYLIASRLGGLYYKYFQPAEWARLGLVDNLIIGGDYANNVTEEFVIGSMDTVSPNNDPKRFAFGNVKVDRWMTIFDWGLRENQKRTEKAKGVPTRDVIREAVEKAVFSGVNGILLHEAFLVEMYDDWNFLATLTCKVDDGRDSDQDGLSDCRECQGLVGCPAAFENGPLNEVTQSYADARGKAPTAAEIEVWLPQFRDGKATRASLTSLLAGGVKKWTDTGKRNLVHSAYLEGRGYPPTEAETAYWLPLLGTNERGYRAVVNGIVAGLVRLSDASMGNLIGNAFYLARGVRPEAAEISRLRGPARASSFKDLVALIAQEHRVWSENDIDVVIQRAYALQRGRAATREELVSWRLSFRAGKETFDSIRLALR